MQKLIEGIHHFQANVFAEKQQLFERLVDSQSPLALFITCSDSRINPNLITQTEPGELFILRNAGNIVPPFGPVNGGEAGTIEYAVSVLKVRDIVVCGHSHCGAMGALFDSSTARYPAVQSWLSNAEATRRIVSENYTHVTDPRARLAVAVEENVLVQTENLRTHPAVAAAVSRQQLTLHAWVYKFETGQVFSYDPELQQYLPLKRPTRAAAPRGAAQPSAVI
jgi:carbonic anhydrase